MRGGQVAIEYMILISIAVFVLMPLIILYYNQADTFRDQTAAALAERATREIVSAADSVYYLGSPSSRTISVELPRNVKNLQITGQSISLLIGSSYGDFEQVSWSAANLTGNFSISHGPHVLIVTALPNGKVNISE